jgi:hypothetical protein
MKYLQYKYDFATYVVPVSKIKEMIFEPVYFDDESTDVFCRYKDRSPQDEAFRLDVTNRMKAEGQKQYSMIGGVCFLVFRSGKRLYCVCKTKKGFLEARDAMTNLLIAEDNSKIITFTEFFEVDKDLVSLDSDGHDFAVCRTYQAVLKEDIMYYNNWDSCAYVFRP